MSNLSLTLPVPETFTLESFNDAWLRWRRYLMSQEINDKDFTHYSNHFSMILGERQMNEIKAMAYCPQETSVTKVFNFNDEDNSSFWSVNLIEKVNEQNWLEIVVDSSVF